MENVIKFVMANDIEGMKLGVEDVNAPVMINGKPVGFICGVDENFIQVMIWKRNVVIEFDDNVNFMGIGLEI